MVEFIELGKIDIVLGEHFVRIFDRGRWHSRCLSKEIAIKTIQRYFKDRTTENRHLRKNASNQYPPIFYHTAHDIGFRKIF